MKFWIPLLIAWALGAHWGVPWWGLALILCLAGFWGWEMGIERGVEGAIEWLKRQPTPKDGGS